MKHVTATVLALALTAAAGTASAQQYSSYPSSGAYPSQGGYSDYARVIRVNPVYDPRGSYAASTGGQRCTESRTYAGNDPYYDGYDRNGDGYRDDQYASNGYDRYGNPIRQPTQVGSTAATVIGGIVGAVVGSQVGGGSARYATSAIGTMVGSQVGKQIYDNAHRQPARVGHVTTCDPMPMGAYESGRNVQGYDVTYEYGGRQYTTRTSYDPGSRIRVRVDVRPE
ncbi:glycine zipper 2TM domain-containing protein [Lysobacter sp. TY2-98]|uniref:glycine zipper 2TM domain-containing protein n=1 Tax=Lysobacter sp. TY2-98 TaxID=2290922 RepID=UPI000E1FBEBA|nr:glycine zipper 2TM domain-containing protein [Lysobacter sp. TY2-98]AXK71435.1 glycine zipper 2TM domain-containing protein [Lysobacter sp. TY2-98]